MNIFKKKEEEKASSIEEREYLRLLLRSSSSWLTKVLNKEARVSNRPEIEELLRDIEKALSNERKEGTKV